MIGCATWASVNDFGGHGNVPVEAATTVEECQAECRLRDGCMGIDWIAGASTGEQCWLVGSWTTWSGNKPGTQRHILLRICGQQWLYIWWNRILRYRIS